jgi:tetratricopeptide (TPR) repeat protein
MGDRLRPVWDFDDVDTSEQRFRELLEREPDDVGRAEVLTQLARVEGLRGRFDDADHLLDEAAAIGDSSQLARVRIDLERGRVRRSSGDPEAALPLFVSAFEGAQALPHEFLAVDAAHMAAIAAPDRSGRRAWTDRAIELARASGDPEVVYWLGPLYNNLGWDDLEAGDAEGALDSFELALAERERRPDNPSAIAHARYGVGRALREVGRAEEAAAQLEQAVAWADATGKPDGWFHEELAEDYAALGHAAEAAGHARLALELLPEQDDSFAEDGERRRRLGELAAIP